MRKIIIFCLFILFASSFSSYKNDRTKYTPWTYLLLDENFYPTSWDSGVHENCIYFIGNVYSDKNVNDIIKGINKVYMNQKKYQHECKISAKKNGYSTIGNFTVYTNNELNKLFNNRIEFDDFNKNEREGKEELSKGERIKIYKYFGKAYSPSGKELLKSEQDSTDVKKYILIKHYFIK
jgi:hypothetical protein